MCISFPDSTCKRHAGKAPTGGTGQPTGHQRYRRGLVVPCGGTGRWHLQPPARGLKGHQKRPQPAPWLPVFSAHRTAPRATRQNGPSFRHHWQSGLCDEKLCGRHARVQDCAQCRKGRSSHVRRQLHLGVRFTRENGREDIRDRVNLHHQNITARLRAPIRDRLKDSHGHGIMAGKDGADVLAAAFGLA